MRQCDVITLQVQQTRELEGWGRVVYGLCQWGDIGLLYCLALKGEIEGCSKSDRKKAGKKLMSDMLSIKIMTSPGASCG